MKEKKRPTKAKIPSAKGMYIVGERWSAPLTSFPVANENNFSELLQMKQKVN